MVVTFYYMLQASNDIIRFFSGDANQPITLCYNGNRNSLKAIIFFLTVFRHCSSSVTDSSYDYIRYRHVHFYQGHKPQPLDQPYNALRFMLL